MILGLFVDTDGSIGRELVTSTSVKESLSLYTMLHILDSALLGHLLIQTS